MTFGQNPFWKLLSLTFIELKAKALLNDLEFSRKSFALWLSPNHKFWISSEGCGKGCSPTFSPQQPLSAFLSSLRHRMLQLPNFKIHEAVVEKRKLKDSFENEWKKDYSEAGETLSLHLISHYF